jgi:glycerol-3-phosphate dehydrogenase
MATAALSSQERTRALSTLAAEELDLLIVGGGVVGAGTRLTP